MPSLPRPRAAPAAPEILGPVPPPIVRGPGTTVHAQIEDWLAELISVGRLGPGDRMPTEQDLAAWLGVSRMTLRHALANLARRGLVTRTVGRNKEFAPVIAPAGDDAPLVEAAAPPDPAAQPEG